MHVHVAHQITLFHRFCIHGVVPRLAGWPGVARGGFVRPGNGRHVDPKVLDIDASVNTSYRSYIKKG